MKRLVVTLTSLALVGVACGRVDPVEDDASGARGGGLGDGDLTGSGGKTASGGKTTGSGGSSGKGMVGGSFAGAPGKVGPEIGGAPNELGSDAGAGGAAPSAGGAPPDGADACALYCSAYTQVCPEAGFGDPGKCTQDCLAALELDSAACNAGKLEAYACIGNALLEAPNDCGDALSIAKQRCGSASPQVDACNATCIASSIYGDGTGCHASAECNGLGVDLNCLDLSGGVPCTCSIGGKVVWDIATGFDYSKAGCIDEDLFRLCAKELP